MAKIPAPKRSDGDCIKFAGMTVCPHTVYLTKAQKKQVNKIHSVNVAKMKNLKSGARGA